MEKRYLKVREMDDDKLAKELKKHNLGLTTYEARKIAELLRRDPTLVELHIFNVEWSEHCSYKSSRTTLKEFLPTSAPNVIQGPEEDAGIIELCTIEGERYGLVIAHESHNHPSQVLPLEGAATGIGGIVRDVNCMGAEVVGVANSLRFGNPNGRYKERTRWIAQGVVDGIWQYGNALGVPNLGGDVVFSDCFDDNCLVNVIAIGVVKEKEIIHSKVPPQANEKEYEVILVGKPTDDSGFGGVAFASEILNEEEERRGAVQVPDPFLKNVLFKANREVFKLVREKNLKIGFKDLGGGGLACAASEIGSSGGFGLEIDLNKVHISLPNLLPEVICCAETQERYILIVPSEITEEVLKIYNQDWDLPNVYEGARASVIGKVIKEKKLRLWHKGEEDLSVSKIVCEADIDKITRGIIYDRKEKERVWTEKEPEFDLPKDLGEVLLKILSSPNVASREYIYRFYDTEVQGNTVIRPGEADAGVIAPIPNHPVGVALSCDGNPAYGKISPYWGGATAVAESMRNVAAVGAVPSCLTDCLNFGNPEKPTAFWEFREGVRGLTDAAKNLYLKGYPHTPVPIVSGNVSFYNESAKGIAIDPSPIICCIGILEDVSKAITMQLKQEGNLIYLVGKRFDELGGSIYYQEMLGVYGCNVPKVRYEEERGMLYGVIEAVNLGYIASCHDISNGGLIVTIAEMMMGGGAEGELGAEIDLKEYQEENSALNLRIDKLLFSESSGFVLEVPKKFANKVEEIFRNYKICAYRIGKVIKDKELRIKAKELEIKVQLTCLKSSWLRGLPEAMR